MKTFNANFRKYCDRKPTLKILLPVATCDVTGLPKTIMKIFFPHKIPKI